MKKLIIYTTKHGATKQYAEWIAKEAKADIVDMKGGKHIDFNHYDKIVIGCPIYAGSVRYAEFAEKNWTKLRSKKVGIFTVSGYEAGSSRTKGSYERSFPENV